MADFLMLMRGGDEQMAKFSDVERQAHIDRWGRYMGELGQSGSLTGGAPLGPGARVISGESRAQSEGAYAEGAAVGGYILVTADSLEAAVKLTEGCPIFTTGGCVEVREIAHM